MSNEQALRERLNFCARERDLLIKECAAAKTENAALRSRVHELETRVRGLSAINEPIWDARNSEEPEGKDIACEGT